MVKGGDRLPKIGDVVKVIFGRQTVLGVVDYVSPENRFQVDVWTIPRNNYTPHYYKEFVFGLNVFNLEDGDFSQFDIQRTKRKYEELIQNVYPSRPSRRKNRKAKKTRKHKN